MILFIFRAIARLTGQKLNHNLDLPISSKMNLRNLSLRLILVILFYAVPGMGQGTGLDFGALEKVLDELEPTPTPTTYGKYSNNVMTCHIAIKEAKHACDSAYNQAAGQAAVISLDSSNIHDVNRAGKSALGAVGTSRKCHMVGKTARGIFATGGSTCIGAWKTADLPTVCSVPDVVPTADPDLTQYHAAVAKISELVVGAQAAQADYSNVKFGDGWRTSTQLAQSCGKTWKALKVGTIVGATAIAGVVAYSGHKKKEEKKEQRKEAAEDFEKGIVADAKGQKMDCLTPSTYTKAECKPVLFNYCSKTENANNAGCTAFNNNYCSGPEASQGFCLAQSSAAYCAQTGPLVAASPTCQWLSSRPATCSKDPTSLSCLPKVYSAQLDTECAKYPNDPICQKHKSGELLTQPGQGMLTANAASANSNSAGTLSELIGSSTQASTSAPSLWSSNSSAHTTLCSSGQLSCGSSGSSK